MATQKISALAERVAASHEARKKKTTKKKKPAAKRKTTKKPAAKRKPKEKEEAPEANVALIEREINTLDPTTEFSYSVDMHFTVTMSGLPYVMISEASIRGKLKDELKKALKMAVNETARSKDLSDPKIQFFPIGIEKSVNSG